MAFSPRRCNRGGEGVILIFAAMQSEVSTCLAWLRDYRESEVAGFPVLEGEGVVICQTGLGRRSKDAADAVIAQYPSSVVLSVGVAGGLHPNLECGDVIICEQIDHVSHKASRARNKGIACDARLANAALAAAKGMGLPASTGKSLTLDEPAWTVDEKTAHHEWKRHDIVEMESFWVGEAANRAGVPFLAIRTISDASGHSLPNTGAMQPDGNFDEKVLLAYVAANPEAGPLFAEFAERARPAFGNLAIVLAAFVPPLIEHFATGVR